MADTAFFLQYVVNQMYCTLPCKKSGPSPNASTNFDLLFKPVQKLPFFIFFKQGSHFVQLNVGMWFLYFKLLGTTSRHDKLSNKPKMGSIATILSNLRPLEKCPKNYLPQKKPIFDHFLVQIDNLKLFLVLVGTYIWYRWKAHRIWRRSVKKLGTYH